MTSTASDDVVATGSTVDTVSSSSFKHQSLSERLIQARNNRRSFTNANQSKNQVVENSSMNSNASSVSTTTSTSPSLDNENNTTIAKTSVPTLSTNYSGLRYGGSNNNIKSSGDQNHPSIIATKSSGGASSSSSTTTAVTTNNTDSRMLHQRYRTIPGLTSTTSVTSSESNQGEVNRNVNSTNTSKSSTVGLGKYRPSSNVNKDKDKVSTVTPPPQVQQFQSSSTNGNKNAITTTSTPSASPARTWRNIHELVQKIEDNSNSTTSKDQGSSIPSNRAKEVTHTKLSAVTNQHKTKAVPNPLSKEPPPPVRSYRNLHNTLSSTSTNAVSKSSEPGVTKPTNNWKYNRKNINVGGVIPNDVNNEKTANNLVDESSNPQSESIVSNGKVVAAPHSYVPSAQQQFSFVPSPTNGSTASSSSGIRKKINLVGGGDETSTKSFCGSNHTIGSGISSTQYMKQAPPPISSPSSSTLLNNSKHLTVSAGPSVSTNSTPAVVGTTTTTSPVSLTLSNSRSFGSQYSTKSPSESTTNSAKISTGQSWKSSISKKNNETIGQVVYGSPIPAWKKKLLEQQRLQQEQEKSVKSVPKWKQKQMQQQQHQQGDGPAMDPPSKFSAVIDSVPQDIITATPSDEVRDEMIDQVNDITTKLSNTAIIKNDILPGPSIDSLPSADVTGLAPDTNSTSSRGNGYKNNNKWPPNQPTDTLATASTAVRPRLRLGASPETHNKQQSVPINSPWFHRTHPSTIEEEATQVPVTGSSDIVGVPSEDTYSIPSPDKEDPADQSGIGESTSLLSPRRRGELAINPTVDEIPPTARNPKQWESPRTARLEAMKANANNTQTNTPFSRPLPRGNESAAFTSNQAMKSPDTSASSAKKWQPPSKTHVAVQATTIPKVTNEVVNEKIEPLTNPSSDDVVEESGSHLRVAEMKAKLWGTGKTEKLVVPTKEALTRANAAAIHSKETTTNGSSAVPVFSSPVRSNTTFNDRASSAKTPPKAPMPSSYQTTSGLSPIPPTFSRGRPDVCTPNGPLPPQRSSSRGDRSIHAPPRRNLDTLWMNRLERTNAEYESSPPRVADSQVESNYPNEPTAEDNTDLAHSSDANTDGNVEQLHELAEQLPKETISPPVPPPPTELSSHYRSPSVGDFPVSALLGEKETVDNLQSELLASPPISPRAARPSSPVSPTILPAVMTKFDTYSQQPKSETLSPTSRRLPPKLPPTSPKVTERRGKSNFSETIDCPPLDDSERWGTDADITGPREFNDSTPAPPPLSPQFKDDRPWKKDANTLPPSSWAKHKIDPANDVDSLSPPRVRHDEEKKSSEIMMNVQSPSSLMRMAADSIHAVDYDKAVQGLMRRSIMDDEDDSQGSGGTPGSAIPSILPPEFEKAMSETEGFEMKEKVAVFAEPSADGAESVEAEADRQVRVSDRVKSLDSWNGGSGPVDATTTKVEIAPTISPIRREESDNDLEGMSPRVSKRGFALDDWKRTKSFDSKSDFETSSDFWLPSIADNPELDLSLSTSEFVGSATVPPTSNGIGTQPVPLLEKSKMDSNSRPKMTWKKKPIVPKADGTSVPPRPVPKSSTTKIRKSEPPVAPVAVGQINRTQPNASSSIFDPFDPFELSFSQPDNAKLEFTETTEFSDSTDFFSSSATFPMDPSSFHNIQEQKLPTTPKTIVQPPSGDMQERTTFDGPLEEEEEDNYLYGNNDSPPTLSGLNPPSGSNLSQYEVWSYDADVSNIQDGAAEI